MAALPISFAAMLLGLSLISSKRRIFGFAQGLLGSALAAIGWLSFVDTLAYASYVHAEHQFLVSILPLSILLLITAEREGDEVMRYLGSAGACVSILVNLWNHPADDAALLALLTGAGVALAGYQQRRKAVFVIGWSGSILGIGYCLPYAIDF